MKRTIIKIDEDLCNGCGQCAQGCAEGALQIIDGKAKLVSDLFCDGLGACIGECPLDAITLEEREAMPYNEKKVMERIVKGGENTIAAHLEHLEAHGAYEYLKEAKEYLKENSIPLPEKKESCESAKLPCGCPSAEVVDMRDNTCNCNDSDSDSEEFSMLSSFPIQLGLVPHTASFLKNADLLLVADCTAFAMGTFHKTLLKGKSLVIACPKLDSGIEGYVEKLSKMIDEAKINTITVVRMHVPCCGGLTKIALTAREKAERNIPIKVITVNPKGQIISDEWL